MGPGTCISKRYAIIVRRKLHSVISDRDIYLTAQLLLLLSVVRPSLEYGSEIWDCNRYQTRALESRERKRFLGILLKRVMKLFGVTWAWKL